ncbi:3-deoxy-7-phosphoheptulonate synthase [bacterium]|nr:3-deoxy-7-phosphoheptulonate synthase [bacterium]
MIVVMEPGTSDSNIQRVIKFLERHNFRVVLNQGDYMTVVHAIGNKRLFNPMSLESLEGVKEVKIIQEPYKLASREAHPKDTIVNFDNGVKVGGYERPVVIAGPCSVEAEYQGLLDVAYAVKEMGCQFLRGGAFKPRTSPYDFQGLEEKALIYLARAKEKTGLLIVSEIIDAADMPMFESYIDLIQIGARNMQNFSLLKAVGKSKKPVLLKRGCSASIREFLLAAEYIMCNGNENVILCERGIKSFDQSYTRNVLDLSAVPIIKKYSHLPIIVDPSHATGRRYLIEPMSKAALVSGAHGVMMEVHHDPDNASSDGEQSLSVEQFTDITKRLNKLIGRIDYDNRMTKQELNIK